jgi:hypothetical protein
MELIVFETFGRKNSNLLYLWPEPVHRLHSNIAISGIKLNQTGTPAFPYNL